ncbi:MAG: hypothetical protein JO254_08350 [Pseudolabrys sp.]|nr:hypothetical protein [Pseudolabrys sp.]
MKYLATVLALAALSASPALAAPKHAAHHVMAPSDAYAAAYQDSGVVWSDGQYLGRDPDPNVRSELLRGQVINAD